MYENLRKVDLIDYKVCHSRSWAMPILVLQSLMKILTNVQWKYFNRKDAWDHSQNNLSEPWHNIQVNLVVIIITITLILILIAYILIGFYNSK